MAQGGGDAESALAGDLVVTCGVGNDGMRPGALVDVQAVSGGPAQRAEYGSLDDAAAIVDRGGAWTTVDVRCGGRSARGSASRAGDATPATAPARPAVGGGTTGAITPAAVIGPVPARTRRPRQGSESRCVADLPPWSVRGRIRTSVRSTPATGRGSREQQYLWQRAEGATTRGPSAGPPCRSCRRRADVLDYFTHRAWNGPTEAINGPLEALRRNALGFRNLINYRIRSLLHCGALAL